MSRYHGETFMLVTRTEPGGVSLAEYPMTATRRFDHNKYDCVECEFNPTMTEHEAIAVIDAILVVFPDAARWIAAQRRGVLDVDRNDHISVQVR